MGFGKGKKDVNAKRKAIFENLLKYATEQLKKNTQHSSLKKIKRLIRENNRHRCKNRYVPSDGNDMRGTIPMFERTVAPVAGIELFEYD